ncbi:MAG: PKD domain-containing protein [Patescibacteria group bacterium]|nr:PKD domain-containing protein [Patescibacteria group bacterium]
MVARGQEKKQRSTPEPINNIQKEEAPQTPVPDASPPSAPVSAVSQPEPVTASQSDAAPSTEPKKTSNRPQNHEVPQRRPKPKSNLALLLLILGFLVPFSVFLFNMIQDPTAVFQPGQESVDLFEEAQQIKSGELGEEGVSVSKSDIPEPSLSEQATTNPIVVFIAFFALLSLAGILIGFSWAAAESNVIKKRGRNLIIFSLLGLMAAAFFFSITSLSLQKAESLIVEPEEDALYVSGLLIEPKIGSAPLPVTFDASEVFSNARYYSWSFGDGAKASGVRVQHTYEKKGEFLVELTVTLPSGDIETVADIVSIQNIRPVLKTKVQPESGEVPLSVTFDGSGVKDPDGDIIAYQWQIADQVFDEETVSYVFETPGVYTGTLSVTDNNGETVSETYEIIAEVYGLPTAVISHTPEVLSGQAPFVVRFSSEESVDSDGNILSYTWDFGDGQKLLGNKAIHTYRDSGEYEVKLTVTDDNQSKSTSSVMVYVLDKMIVPEPDIQIFSSSKKMIAPAVVRFDASDSIDVDGEIVEYTWNFGDNSRKEMSQSVEHTYQKAGVYQITLDVTDNDGNTESIAKSIKISSAKQQPPVSDLQVQPDPPSIMMGESIVFDASQSYDLDGRIMSYEWNFGDGIKKMGEAIMKHKYNETGVHKASVTVLDDQGQSTSINKIITVRNLDPVGVISATRTKGFAPLEIDFDALSSQ